MKFTLSWLKAPLQTQASLKELCEKLTAIGLEVESVEDRAALYAPFKVALIESAEPHPDAARLKVCRVKTETGTLQVVCGAPNARAGLKGIFAPEGSYIPGLDTTLTKAKIRGVESSGMMVSAAEMMLSDDSQGIIEVSDALEIGTPMAGIFGLNDAVIEINLTPNRADCAGVYGIARDLAAAGLGTLSPLPRFSFKESFACPVTLRVEDGQGCPHFAGRMIRGVTNGPSPEWLQNLLKAVGLRPISALVDVTNFLSLDHAQPLHVYDADKINGEVLIVREAAGDERLDALNDKTLNVPEGAIAICDEGGVVGLGGIIGGTSTACDDKTQNVFIEAAYFDPMRIARAGRALGLSSDARYRFERGVDPAFTRMGLDLATQMILEICGGEASTVTEYGAPPAWQRSIDYNPGLMGKLIGVDVPHDRQKYILQDLGFTVEPGAVLWRVRPPSWRGDIAGAPDLCEEIIRIHGFESIPAVSVRAAVTVPEPAESAMMARLRKSRTTLAARGYMESITWSFVSAELAALFGLDTARQEALTLRNPIAADMKIMRPSILPGLIAAAGRNADRGLGGAALCECGPVFSSPKPDGQQMVAAGIRSGEAGQRHWADKAANRDIDMFDLKADAMAVLEACGAPGANAQVTRDAPSYYHPGRSGALRLGPKVLAYFGEIHPAVMEDMGVRGPVAGFEVFLDNLPTPRARAGIALLTLDTLQPLQRDFAFVVEENVAAEELLKAARAADKTLIRAADIFDIYTGTGVEGGHKSVALSITIQPGDKTLTEADIEALSQKVIDSVIKKTAARLRA